MDKIDVTEATGKRKPRRPRTTGQAPVAGRLGYVALHETNLALCLASGFIAPRFEESAVHDHHQVAGEVIVELNQPSSKALTAARGSTPYGNIAILEVETRQQQGDEALRWIPLRALRRVFFQSEDAVDEFRARISGYEDVPEDLFEIEVGAALFGDAANSVDMLADVPLVNVESTDQASPAVRALKSLDQTAGALLAACWALGTDFCSGLARTLAPGALTMNSSSSPLDDVLGFLPKPGARAQEEALFAPLLISLASELSETDAADGFSAVRLLRKVEARVNANPAVSAESASALERFFGFARDILSLRRDPPENAFSDEGSPTARGVLLFLLNPEPGAFSAAPKRVPHLGATVFLIAAALVGFRAGLTRLPKSMKANRDRFLGISALSSRKLRDEGATMLIRRGWGVDGASSIAFEFDRLVIARVELPAESDLVAVCASANAVGLRLSFNPEDGLLAGTIRIDELETSIEICRRIIPTFPSIEAFDLTTHLPLQLSKRQIEPIVSRINEDVRISGVHAACSKLKSSWDLRLSLQLLKAPTERTMKEAVDRLTSVCAQSLQRLKRTPDDADAT